MNIGALIGLLVGLIVVWLIANHSRIQAEQFNSNVLNQAMGRRAVYKPNLQGRIIVILFWTTLGAIIGYFVE